ncbi:MAG: hypothetical protein KF749_10040 [Bacteroidetes bacterium]|nr:hypothetical protein [Bacteroidota bacterium]MCW5896694.1 hypothetical protein [Bacteroidota bacterium]
MINIEHPPIVQSTLDRWHLNLPAVALQDESRVTKEHLRLLIGMLIDAIETLGIINDQQSTINHHRSPSPVPGLPAVVKTEAGPRSPSQPEPQPHP